jgi:hypothetical protein
MSTTTSVPVGPTTVGGVGLAAVSFASAIVLYLTGDTTAQQVTAIEVAGGGLLSAIVVMGGRYIQAHKKSGVVGAVLPPAEAVLGEIKQYDPGVTAQVKAFVRSEVAKVEEKLTSEDPAPDVSGLEVSSATPTLGGQEALKVQYATQISASPTQSGVLPQGHPEANS